MATRPNIAPHIVIEDGDMSDDITSDVTIIGRLPMISYAVSWTGTSPVGVIHVQVSNDFSLNADGSVRNEGTWTDLVLDEETNVSGNSGNGFIDIGATSAYAIRLFYERSSGTGTLQAIINSKVM